MNQLSIFTDASRDQDTGVTAVAYVRIDANDIVDMNAIIIGKNSTPQRAEIAAIIYAIQSASPHESSKINIYTDCDAIQKWAKKPLCNHTQNGDLWQSYHEFAHVHDIEIYWLKRNQHHFSVLADNLARGTLREYIKNTLTITA